jgi:hypothetical protein
MVTKEKQNRTNVGPMVSYCQAARIDTQDKENGADSSQMY